MDLSNILLDMPAQKKKQVKKVIDTLKIGGRSDSTILNYVCAINRFLKYSKNKDISKFNEDDILEYMKLYYLNKNRSSYSYNMNISAIKYFFIVNYRKTLSNQLLPHAKTTRKIPLTIDKDLFITILNEEPNLKHKCWLLLGYCSGLRVEEISEVKIKDINSKEHRLKVLGKRNKERYTLLPDITIKYLRLYYKYYYKKNYCYLKNEKEFLFKGLNSNEHMNSRTISNYFWTINKKYNLNKKITFHTLRHSFATNFIKAGGDPFVLKSMMGHTSMSTTAIYVHMGRDFNNLKGVNYDGI